MNTHLTTPALSGNRAEETKLASQARHETTASSSSLPMNYYIKRKNFPKNLLILMSAAMLMFSACDNDDNPTTPQAEPTATPTLTPTATPTEEPTQKPVATPTVRPTATPQPQPTAFPTSLPVPTPTPAPSQTPAAAIVIAAVGDSITYGMGSAQGGYPAMLEWKLRAAGYNVSVQNRGVPGETTGEMRSRINSAVSGAKIALIMGGTNNVTNCPSPSFCGASNDIAAMIDAAHAAGEAVVIGLIPPIRSSCESRWPNTKVRELNTQYTSAANSHWAAIANNYGAISGSGGDALFVDCLHFNDGGYNAIAQQFYSAIGNNGLLN